MQAASLPLGARARRCRRDGCVRALEPAAARPRRPHLPRRVLRAARLRDLERHLVRRALPARLQRAVPAARRAAVADLGRRPRRRSRARICSTAWCAPAGESRRAGPASGLRRSARSRCSRTAGWCSRSVPRSRSDRCGRCNSAATALAVVLGASGAALSSPVAAVFLRSGRRGRGRVARGRRDRRRRARAAGGARVAVPGGRRVPVLVLGILAAGAVLRARAARDPRASGPSGTCAW